MLGTLFGRSQPDTLRYERTRRSYDEKRGYEQWHRQCRSAFGPTPSRSIEAAELEKTGFTSLPVLSSQQAGLVLDRMRACASPVDARTRDYEDVFVIFDRIMIAETFEEIFSGPIDRTISACFGSEHLIYWWTLRRTRSRKMSERSFLWHCDKGPSSHLKLLLYFNPTAEHGGSTEFANKDTTEAVGRTGYIYGPNAKRRSDLRPLAETSGIGFETTRYDMAAGEAILFEPARVLHRGILPVTGERWVLTLCLVPSPLPWQTVFARTGGFVAHDFAWHRHASEFARLIGHPTTG